MSGDVGDWFELFGDSKTETTIEGLEYGRVQAEGLNLNTRRSLFFLFGPPAPVRVTPLTSRGKKKKERKYLGTVERQGDPMSDELGR
jgi:hypothetical protein